MYDLHFDFSDLQWKTLDIFGPPEGPELEQIDLACWQDRQSLTMGGPEGLKPFCNKCEVLAEFVVEDFEPEKIRCPRCGVNGMTDEVIEAAGIHIRVKVEGNKSRAVRLGISEPDLVADAEDNVRHGGPPVIIPVFVWKR